MLKNPFVFVEELANIKVMPFDSLLQMVCVKREVRLVADPFRKDIIFTRYIEARTAWITLPTAASAKLVINPAALVPVCSNHMKTS